MFVGSIMQIARQILASNPKQAYFMDVLEKPSKLKQNPEKKTREKFPKNSITANFS